jgi:hypothetical protein
MTSVSRSGSSHNVAMPSRFEEQPNSGQRTDGPQISPD